MTKRLRTMLSIAGLALIVLMSAAVWKKGHREITLIGVVDANEVVVTPPVQAWLDTLLVEEGTSVHAGQPIAALDRGEIAAQALSAASSAATARAQVDQASSSALQTEREASADRASAAARVSEAQAQLTREEAELERKKADAERIDILAKAGSVSSTEREHAQSDLRVQQASAAAARESLSAAQAELRRAEAAVLSADAARRNVTAMRARLRGAEADSVAAGARLNYTDLRAPVAGVINVIVARQGELVGPNAPVAVIVDADHPWVRVAAPESDAGAVAVGDSLVVRFASGEHVVGRVLSKSVEGDFATQHDVSASKRDVRAVAFRVSIPNPRRLIVPGMSAEVVLPRVHRD